MGRGDNRLTRKMRKRVNQKKKKLRLKKIIEEAQKKNSRKGK